MSLRPLNSLKSRALALTIGVFLLAGCESLGLSSEAQYENKQREDLYRDGSILSEGGGVSLLGGNEPGVNADNNGLGVNGYLWRATLDTISFMPIASADPFGGVITTDWFSPPASSEERIKLNVFIIDRELRADGVKVSVFRQTLNSAGNWIDAAPAAATGSQLEETILTRARQMRMAQKEGK